jgi:hypothetical protein
MSGLNVGVGGAWKSAKPFVGVGGVWKAVQAGFVGVGGVWKQFYTAVPAMSVTPVNGSWFPEYDSSSGVPVLVDYVGSCSVSVSGGVAPYTYSWPGGTDTYTERTASPYNRSIDCTVTDSVGTSQTVNAQINP